MIFFVNQWEKDKKSTWSGTPMNLLESLQRLTKNDEVLSIDIPNGGYVRFLSKLWRGTTKILSIDGCDWIEHLLVDKQVDRLLRPYRMFPAVLFTEYRIQSTKNAYLYIDCSVDFVYRCKKAQEPFTRFLPMMQSRRYSFIEQRKARANQFYHECKGIFTMGRWQADDLIENTGIPRQKVHCVGGGCNISLDKIDMSHKQGNKFLFIGKDFERKGGAMVVKAFELLNEKYPRKYELYIAGPKEWPLEGEIPQGIHFAGRKTVEQLSEYYNMCDVFVMPSYFEAYGIVFAEALIYGLPCIARNAFSMKEFIQEGRNGRLIYEDNVETLSEKMHEVITNPIFRKNVYENHKYYIERYSWDTVACRMLEVIEQDGSCAAYEEI